MKINRRDVVLIAFGSNTREQHPVIVLSPEEINSEEGQFTGIMISKSTEYDPNNDWSFPLNDSMFIHELKEKGSRVRLYLINFLPTNIISKKINEMRVDAFKNMVAALNTKIFGV